VLEVKEIEVAYGPAVALHGVDLTLNEGEMVFIVGRNGAGKTTLLKTVCGLLSPRRGEILLAGQSIAGRSAENLAREGVRYVAQDKRVFSELTVGGNIDMAAYAAGKDPEEAKKMLLSLYPQMERFWGSKAGGLSGGQREILLIGRALVGQPRLLMIDEPTEGLAAVVIKDIFNILTSMKQMTAAIIVEQNLAVVGKLADRVYIMKEGKIAREITQRDDIPDTAMLESYL
jgi:branched-chain amino acid transport system ATP-binding protein